MNDYEAMDKLKKTASFLYGLNIQMREKQPINKAKLSQELHLYGNLMYTVATKYEEKAKRIDNLNEVIAYKNFQLDKLQTKLEATEKQLKELLRAPKNNDISYLSEEQKRQYTNLKAKLRNTTLSLEALLRGEELPTRKTKDLSKMTSEELQEHKREQWRLNAKRKYERKKKAKENNKK